MQTMHNLHAFVLVVSEETIRKYSMKQFSKKLCSTHNPIFNKVVGLQRVTLVTRNGKMKLAIKVQIFAASEISGRSYCNRNADGGTKTDSAKLIFIW